MNAIPKPLGINEPKLADMPLKLISRVLVCTFEMASFLKTISTGFYG